MMNSAKPVFLKTYGKQKRKLSAWVSLQNRKQVFDSTSASSEADLSAQEVPKPARIRRRNNLTKTKAPAQLIIEDEDNVFSQPKPPSRKRTTRKQGIGRGVRSAKRKAVSCLRESSDEENIAPPTFIPQAYLQKKTRGKKTRLCSDKTAHSSEKAGLSATDNCSDEMCSPLTQQNNTNSGSESGPSVTSEGVSAAKWNNLQQSNTDQKVSHVHLPSAGRFVTRRRYAISENPRLFKAAFSTLNSSDEFTSARGTSQNIHPSRRKVPPVFLESSTDNSVNAAGFPSFATNPLREISLNESTEHSLGPCYQKPIFCSTPSADSLSKKVRLKQFDQISSPPSMSVSCIGPVSTFQEDLGSPEQLCTPPHSAPSVSSDEKTPVFGEVKCSQLRHEESSDHLFTRLKSTYEITNSSGAAKNQSEEQQTQDIQELPSVISIDSDMSSYFMSATGGLEWLLDFLKEKCLTQVCTVRLERLEYLTLSQLFSETTYSSCLGYLGSVCSPQAKEVSLKTIESSEPCSSLEMFVTERDNLQSGECSKSPLHDVMLVTDSQSTAMSDDHKQSMNKSTVDLFSGSMYFTNSSSNLVADMQVQKKKEDLSTMIKNKCLSRECTVQLQKLEANVTGNYNVKFRQSLNNSVAVCQSQPGDPESEGAPLVLAKVLKEKCLNCKPVVKIKKMSITEIKEYLQEGTAMQKTNMSELVSEQTVNEPQSESNCTMPSPKETSVGARLRKRSSATLNDRTASDIDVSKSSNNRCIKKGKKLSVGPKENKRRTATNRPGTSRKACVSGLSVSRWKNKDVFSSSRIAQGTKAVDCSISELIPSQHRQTVEQFGHGMNFSTPVKGNNLNLSSLLAELTPNTHTWSRLKAALSIHRKVMLTPKIPDLGSSTRFGFADLSQDLFGSPFRTPLSKHLRSQLLSHDSEHVFEGDDLSDAEKVYAECGQQGPLAWDNCILPQRMKQCLKIGEGTFGEVFSTTNEKGDTVALKVIPVEGSEKVNGEEQKTFGEILHEIIISKELSSLKENQRNQTHGFIGVLGLHCVRGCYPPDFLKAWDHFDKQRGSENDRPDFFRKDQLFIILEFEFGGSDLENSNGSLGSLLVAKSILHQVTAALAVAEQELHFEHRDLHWGNVLVKTTKQKTAAFSLNGSVHLLDTKGVLVRIIDYSLSRLEIDELTVSCDISKDEELFMGQGDYQFDIYRLMRQENGNNWSNYNPHTNVLWLHYLCSKLLFMKYRGSGGKHAKDTREELTRFYDNVLQYSSATEVLQNCPLFQ